MSTRHESHDHDVDYLRREASTAPRKNVYYDDYEDFRAPSRQPSFIQQSSSTRNSRALVLRERTRSRPSRTLSSDKRQGSWTADVGNAGGYRTGESTRYGSGVTERRHRSPTDGQREIIYERARSPMAVRERDVERDVEGDIEREREREPDRGPPPRVVISNRIYEERRKSLVRGGVPMKGVQMVLGPESDRDTAIHLELDIEGDVESQLEEFSRLKRLGNFHLAEEYFQENLHEYLGVPPIAVEYAEMLLQQGAYQRLKDLVQKKELNAPIPPPSEASSPSIASVPVARAVAREKDREIKERPVSPRPQPVDAVDKPAYEITRIYKDEGIKSDAERFDQVFHLIEAASQMHAQGLLLEALSKADDAEQEFYKHRRRKHPFEGSSLSPAEVQLINCWHDIQSYVSRRSGFVYPESAKTNPFWSEWSGLYNSLRTEGRIWELRDAISSSLLVYGATKTWDILVGEDLYSADFITGFLDEWGVNREYDESTYLAILAILVELCQNFLQLSDLLFERDATITTKRCLEHARRFATCIKENDPLDVKSRPYILWIIVQKGLGRRLADTTLGASSAKPGFNNQYLYSLPGLTLGTSILPIYVPIKCETPGWPVLEQPAKTDELLQHALKASQELADYNTEVACLREMICRSPQPKQLFERLTYVQKTLQGDMVGYLETLLSKYFLVTDEESRQSLIEDLSAFDAHQRISHNIEDPLIQWCQRMVQAQLYRASGRYPAETAHFDRMAQDIFDSMPRKVIERAIVLGFVGNSHIPWEQIATGRASARYPKTPSPPPPSRGKEDERRRQDYEMKRIRAAEEAHIKEELELKRLFEEKQEIELKMIKEEEVKKAAEKYQFEKAKEEARKKAVQEAEERKYQERLKADLQRAGLDPRQIAAIQGQEAFPAPRPTYTRMARRDISLETLNRYRVDYEIDQDPDYVIIKRWVPKYEQDLLWNHTKAIRLRRGGARTVAPDEERKPIPAEQNIEPQRRTISLSKEAHQAPESSADAISKRSWAQDNQEAEVFDINQPLSPRVEDNKLYSGDANNADVYDENLPREHDDHHPSSPHPSSISSHFQEHGSPPPPVNHSHLEDTKGKGREDETEGDENTTNDADDDAIDTKKHSHPRKLKKTMKRKPEPEPEPEDPIVLKEQAQPLNIQGLQMETSSRPEERNRVVVTEDPPSSKLQKRYLFAHAESVADANDAESVSSGW